VPFSYFRSFSTNPVSFPYLAYYWTFCPLGYCNGMGVPRVSSLIPTCLARASHSQSQLGPPKRREKFSWNVKRNDAERERDEERMELLYKVSIQFTENLLSPLIL